MHAFLHNDPSMQLFLLTFSQSERLPNKLNSRKHIFSMYITFSTSPHIFAQHWCSIFLFIVLNYTYSYIIHTYICFNILFFCFLRYAAMIYFIYYLYVGEKETPDNMKDEESWKFVYIEYTHHILNFIWTKCNTHICIIKLIWKTVENTNWNMRTMHR